MSQYKGCRILRDSKREHLSCNSKFLVITLRTRNCLKLLSVFWEVNGHVTVCTCVRDINFDDNDEVMITTRC